MLEFFRNSILLVSLSAVLSCIEIFGIGCPPLDPPYGGQLYYDTANKSSSECEYPVGTVVSVTCDEFHVTEGNYSSVCLNSGNWSTALLKCIPDCGKLGAVVSLIVHGSTVRPANVPWHVAIYHKGQNEFELWCGGTLISDSAVLTAAHCTWEVKPENLRLAFGKFYRNFNATEMNSQILRARKIETLKTYQDALGNYNGDISVIFLNGPVKLNSYVRPACIDWDQSRMAEQLKEGSVGRVVGWGLTENNTFSEYLRVASLPVASYENCLRQYSTLFRKYVTFTTFCAGFNNGTGVCNGDSGGGLIFFDKNSERWFVQGLVSISPRKKGTSYCDPKFYAVFTKVNVFKNWLESLNIFELKMGERRNDGQCESEKNNIGFNEEN